MKFGRNPYLILFIIMISVGVISAYAITITLAGDVTVTGNMDVIGTVTSPTTDTMQSSLNSLDSRVTTLEGGCTPSTEVCDGIDNDCDTMVDEDFPTLGNLCVAGVGQCSMQDFLVCNGAQDGVVCNATSGSPQTEVCDGLDNSCSGAIDDGFLNSGKYDQDSSCGSCFTDCTTIYDNASAYGSCDSTGAPVCQMSCCTIGDPNPACDGIFDYLDADGIPENGCEFQLDPDGIYVSETDGVASDTVGCGSGSPSTPCATINFGLGRAIAEGKTNVYVADGFYNESISLVPGINLLGGYEPLLWTHHASSTLTFVQGNSVTTHKETITANSIATPTTLDGFIIIGQDNPTSGGNSYGIRIIDSDSALVINNNKIYAGIGGLGIEGTNGSNGLNGVDGSAGQVGFFTGQDPCTSENDLQLSNGGVRLCGESNVSGGNGGGISCAPLEDTETSGTDGFSGQVGADGLDGAAGTGGDAGDDALLHNSGSTCDVPTASPDGVDGLNGSNGGNGPAGVTCSDPSGSVIGNHWVAGAASNGLAGGHGGGGGGGGAGGGSDSGSGVSDDGLGGHGGGAGSGACGGNGGSAGTSGGGSFGIFVVFNSTPASIPSITNNEIHLGHGGNGGAGGNGGIGGLGASGAISSGAGPFCTGVDGAGGAGGNGGHGSGAAGSCGGASYGIFANGQEGADLSLWSSGNPFNTIGSPGSGGSGGWSPANNGPVGQTGSQTNTNF